MRPGMAPAGPGPVLSAGSHVCNAAAFWPSGEPCPSDESSSLCVSSSHQQSMSFPGHSKDRAASGYGTRVNLMIFVFSNTQMPFLTSICCLDIVRTNGNKCPAAWCTPFLQGCSAVFVNPLWPLSIYYNCVEGTSLL